MSSFDSPNFKKSFPAQTQKMREFNVGAPEDVPQMHHNVQTFQQMHPGLEGTATEPVSFQSVPRELEQSIEQARKEKFEAPKISGTGKKRIELLANIGRLTKDVPIGGSVFTLRTLKSKEAEEATRAIFANATTQLDGMLEARKQQLARALYKIDGQELGFVINAATVDDKVAFIGELEDIMVEKLWENFTALKEEARTKFGISNDNEAKEVVEDLKK